MPEGLGGNSKQKQEARSLELKARTKLREGQGWQSTGDLPYTIANKLGIAERDRQIANHIKTELDKILQGKGPEYIKNDHVEKISIKTFVSPELALELEEVFRQKYAKLIEAKRNQTP